MEPREYANDVAIRLGCNVDVGRYVSVTDDLPSAFAPNHAVDVQVENTSCTWACQVIVKMRIVNDRKVKDGSCTTSK
jgi:hypothetical protein